MARREIDRSGAAKDRTGGTIERTGNVFDLVGGALQRICGLENCLLHISLFLRGFVFFCFYNTALITVFSPLTEFLLLGWAALIIISLFQRRRVRQDTHKNTF